MHRPVVPYKMNSLAWLRKYLDHALRAQIGAEARRP
jgi:hypothetical protein